MVCFEEILLVLSRDDHLSVRECVNLELVRHSVCDIARLRYPLVTDLSSFGITSPMIYNAFRDTRYKDAFFSRFDCNRLTSMRVPWDPKTIRGSKGISCSSVRKLLQQCPNLVELPPVMVQGLVDSLDILPEGQTRSFNSVTLYGDWSRYKLALLKDKYITTNAKNSFSVRHVEIRFKIDYNYNLGLLLKAFVRFLNAQFDKSAIKSIKIFIASKYSDEYRMSKSDVPDGRHTIVDLPLIFSGWNCLETLAITLQHSVLDFVLCRRVFSVESCPALKSLSIAPLLDDGEDWMGVTDLGTLDCMPKLEHFYIGNGGHYHLGYIDYHKYKVRGKTQKDCLMRKISVMNKSNIEHLNFCDFPEDLATPDILVRIGESGCLKSLTISRLTTMAADILLQILKRNKGIEQLIVYSCPRIADKLFTLLAQAQLRNVENLVNVPCELRGIQRYIQWRMRQIERGYSLAHVDLSTDQDEEDIFDLFPNMSAGEIERKGKITLTNPDDE